LLFPHETPRKSDEFHRQSPQTLTTSIEDQGQRPRPEAPDAHASSSRASPSLEETIDIPKHTIDLASTNRASSTTP
jgi:hypothetical protein